MQKLKGLFLIPLLVCAACQSYRQNIMFRTAGQRLPSGLAIAAASAERNYTIQKNDLLEIRLFSNKGEEIINDNINQNPLGASAGTAGVNQGAQGNTGVRYLVQDNGFARLPLIGMIKLEGLTLHQTDSLLANAYNNFYAEPFVETKFINKRVIVLGAVPGQVIPLQNENMNLIEVIALAGGISNTARVGNIRLIRGDLNNPEVYLVDLSTIEGMANSHLKVKSNDIIYIEPVSKPFREVLADITPVLGLFSSVISIISVILILNTSAQN
jgi:polysaccharide export outer membrane protein